MAQQRGAAQTFLFTDIEGSTRMWERDPDAMAELVEKHDLVMARAVGSHKGTIVKQTGDGVFAVFGRSIDAIHAAVDAQSSMPAGIRSRMGIHAGSAVQRGSDFFGSDVNRAARLMAVAHGGQIVVSADAYRDLGDAPGAGVALKDLGTHRLRDLSEPLNVYQVIAEGLEATFPDLSSLEGFPNNLPADVSSFVGREEDIASVRGMLGSHRLVSLTGAGGTGKTRLSIQVAAEVLPDFPDGAWFVDLAGLSEPDLVPLTIAGAIGLSERAGRDWMEVLLDFARNRTLLLDLDNCEHLLDEVADVVSRLLTMAPGLSVVTTTREPLNVPGEVAWRVPTLDLPGDDAASLDEILAFEGVRLFVERAMAARPDLALTDGDVPDILQICRRLDGLPLALELAAARARVLSISEIAAHLGDRFALLAGGSRAALPRHRTLEGTVAWSYESLSADEQDLFRRLSVFSGGFGLSGATVLGGPDALSGVSALVDKSLLTARPGPDGTRYRMLETVAAFAFQRLGEGFAEVRDSHLQWAAMFAGQAAQELDGKNQKEWLDRVSLELDNLRAAMQWSLDGGEPNLGALIAGSLYRFWYIRGVREGRRWLDLFLEGRPDVPAHMWGRLLFAAGSLTQSMGDYERASAQLRESMGIFDEAGERRAWAYALHYLIRSVWGTIAETELRSMIDTDLEVFRELDDPVGMSLTLLFDAMWHVQYGSVANVDVPSLIEQTTRTGAPQLLAHAAEVPAAVAWYQGDTDAAGPGLADAARIYLDIQNPQCAAHCLENTAGWAANAGRPSEAATLLGAASSLRDDTGIPTPAYERFVYDDIIDMTRERLGDRFEEAWARGSDMSMDQALDYVVQLASEGRG